MRNDPASFLDWRDHPLQCYICGKPATVWINRRANLPSNSLAQPDMAPVCDEHERYYRPPTESDSPTQ